MNLLIALVIGLMAGAHSATWGMYKDAIYEGFTYKKYFRSIILSGIIAVVFESVTNLNVARPGNMLILYGMTYVIERAILEFYKTFLREEDQTKYFIPMQFHVQGRVVKSRRTRWLLGGACLIGLSLAVLGINALQRSDLQLPGWLVVLLIGSVGGWISAFGGAWKDAPIEGFERLKFFRSPVIALSYALLLACFTQNYLYIAMGGLGYTIGTIETYKTFFFPNKPRGKFAGKEIQYPEMLEKRKRFVPLYVAIWVAVVTTSVITFTQPRQGLI
ncbi:MAG: hypothetical protein O7E52_27960 [Candidatus Poribacteria bacterium]|nr:hypothetical protein [Candidatus Poribacteria bacterium]